VMLKHSKMKATQLVVFMFHMLLLWVFTWNILAQDNIFVISYRSFEKILLISAYLLSNVAVTTLTNRAHRFCHTNPIEAGCTAHKIDLKMVI
jgi:hypothetical protein